MSNSIEIRVCLENIQDEIKKLSKFNIKEIEDTFYETKNYIYTDADIVKIQLINEMVLLEQ
jgi:hypothetical protein